MKLTYVVCKLEIKIKFIKVKSETSTLLQIHIHHQMRENRKNLRIDWEMQFTWN